MSVLRQRLREVAPDLFESLERSWKIAQDEWLPAIGTNKDSYNSGPHLRNMENYLDQVLLGFEKIPASKAKLDLRPIELYLLLASVLFHDIGRATEQTRIGASKARSLRVKKDTHASTSGRLIRAKYSHLGVPNAEIAGCLASICAAHTMSLNGCEFSGTDLSEMTIDPYGEIRRRPLAALLVLVDGMDSAYTRVLPNYLIPTEEQDIIGLFRSVIRGVLVDHEAKVVRSVLGDALWRGLTTQPWYGWYNYGRKKPVQSEKEISQHIMRSGTDDMLSPTPLPMVLVHEAGEAESVWDLTTHEHLFGLDVDEWNVARGCCRFEQSAGRARKRATRGVSSALLLAIVMGDVRANALVLDSMRLDLAAIGMPIANWVIEYKEHLYDTWGRETWEPVFTKEYLKNLIDGMWCLSTGVFGESRFTYEELASCIGDSDVARVRRGVRRTAIIVNGVWDRERCGLRGNRGPAHALRAGETHWEWGVVGGRVRGVHCRFAKPDAVKNVVERLGGQL